MGRRKADRRLHPSGPASQCPAKAAVPGVDRLRPSLLAGACGLFVVRPLFPSDPATEGDGLPVVMLWLALAVFWLLGAIGRREFRLRFGWTDAAVLALVGLHTAAAVWAVGHGTPRPAVNMLWEWIGYGVGFFLLRQFIGGPREARAIAAVMIALGVVLSTHGLYQYFYEKPRVVDAYDKNADSMLEANGMWLPRGSPERIVFENRLRAPEPLATFALTNSLAGYLAPWLVVTLAIATLGTGPLRRRGWTWLVLATCALVLLACLLLTKSRTGFLATLLGLAMVGLWAGRKIWLNWKVLAGTAGAAGVVAALVAAAIAVRGMDVSIFSEASKSLGYRLQYWQSTTAMIADHRLLGVGPGNFQPEYTRYKLPDAAEEVADPHNFLFEVAATAGIPALLAVIAVLGTFFWTVLSGLQPTHDRPACLDTDAIRPVASDSPWHPVAGMALGFLLAIPLGLISGNLPRETCFYVGLAGLPIALGSVAGLRAWIERGELPLVIPAIGVAVLLLDLLAAGGIGFPGVAGTLWVLMAIGLGSLCTRHTPCAVPGKRYTACAPYSDGRPLPWWAGFTFLTVAVLSAVACYATAYGPVLECKAHLRAAKADPRNAGKHLAQAAVADRLAMEPWDQLALLALADWQQTAQPAALQRFEEYTEKSLARAPNSSALRIAVADRYLVGIFAKNHQESYLRRAIELDRQAVSLYPNDATTRAKLALALERAGDRVGFRSELETALWLDVVTPHENKKLSAELRKEIERKK